MSKRNLPRPKFYVYILCKPSGEPFYVGCGRGKRIEAHERDAKFSKHKSHKLNVIRKIWRDGGIVGRTFDSYHLTLETALARECELITQIGRHDLGAGPLTNQTGGGDGVRDLSPEIELVRSRRSAETRRRPEMRALNAKRGRDWHEAHPEESAKSIDRLNKASREWRKKFPLLAAVARNKIAAASRRPDVNQKREASRRATLDANPEIEANRRQKWQAVLSDPVITAARNAKIAAAQQRPEYKAARATFFKKWKSENPEIESTRIGKLVAFAKSDANRQRVREQMKVLRNDPEYRRQHSEKMKARWADPEYKARVASKMTKAFSDPEYKRKAGERSKARWADPEFKARMAEKMRAVRERKNNGTQIHISQNSAA